jgi:molybdopterin molybdotransferase
VTVAEAPSELMSVETALERILAAVHGSAPPEEIAIGDALWRVPSQPVVATVSLPPWDNSAMDGYAIRAGDVAEATESDPVRLHVIGDAPAGAAATAAVSAGTAVRIATGAPLPAEADAVVPVELTTPIDAAGQLGHRGRDAAGPLPQACLVHSSVPAGGSIRRVGSDIVAGQTIAPAGRALTPSSVTLAAGAGVSTIEVHRRPLIAVLATGDELRSPGQPLGPAGIPDANGPGLRALVRAAGGEVVDLGIVGDHLEDVTRRLHHGLERGVDALIVSGGVSVGPFDVIKLAFEGIGRLDLWRVAVQPGKPFAFGTAEAANGRTRALLFGLPGNPVSTAVTFELFVRPAIRRLGGHERLNRPPDRAVLLEDVSKSHGRRAFLRVVVERDTDGAPRRDREGRIPVRLAGGAGGQGSHVLSALAVADALAVIPEAADDLAAGSDVELRWLDGPDAGQA